MVRAPFVELVHRETLCHCLIPVSSSRDLAYLTVTLIDSQGGWFIPPSPSPQGVPCTWLFRERFCVRQEVRQACEADRQVRGHRARGSQYVEPCHRLNLIGRSEAIDTKGTDVDCQLPASDEIREEASAGSAAAKTQVSVAKRVVNVGVPH